MKRLGMVMIMLFAAFAAGAPSEAGMKWFTLSEGMERAKTERKPVLVDFFFGKGCPRCEIMQKEIYDNPAIAKKLMDDFIPIMVDLTKQLTPEEEELGRKYDYRNDCLLLFLDHAGDLIKDSAGKKLCFIDHVDPDEFITYLDMVRAKYP